MASQLEQTSVTGRTLLEARFDANIIPYGRWWVSLLLETERQPDNYPPLNRRLPAPSADPMPACGNSPSAFMCPVPIRLLLSRALQVVLRQVCRW